MSACDLASVYRVDTNCPPVWHLEKKRCGMISYNIHTVLYCSLGLGTFCCTRYMPCKTCSLFLCVFKSWPIVRQNHLCVIRQDLCTSFLWFQPYLWFQSFTPSHQTAHICSGLHFHMKESYHLCIVFLSILISKDRTESWPLESQHLFSTKLRTNLTISM